MPVTTSDREHRIALGRIEIDAWRDMVLAAPDDVATDLGLAITSAGGAVIGIMPARDIPAYHRAVDLGTTTPASKPALADVIAEVRRAGVSVTFARPSTLWRSP